MAVAEAVEDIVEEPLEVPEAVEVEVADRVEDDVEVFVEVTERVEAFVAVRERVDFEEADEVVVAVDAAVDVVEPVDEAARGQVCRLASALTGAALMCLPKRPHLSRRPSPWLSQHHMRLPRGSPTNTPGLPRQLQPCRYRSRR